MKKLIAPVALALGLAAPAVTVAEQSQLPYHALTWGFSPQPKEHR